MKLRFHLEKSAGEYQASGASAADARQAAQREFGNLGIVQENARAAWGWAPLEQLMHDLHYGARNLLRNPAFTILACLSLALGIGANTAIFSFMEAMLMRPLPVADAASLVVLKWHVRSLHGSNSYVVHHATGYFDEDRKLGAVGPIFPYPAFELLQRIGIPAALGASKMIESRIFGVKPGDPLALTAALMILLSAALAAGYLPARKASQTDPMAALRHE